MNTRLLAGESTKELARDLCAAYLANHLGISVAYALKKHVSKDIDNYWIDLADKIRKDLYAKTLEEKI